jgi:peptide/nickel transport system permease protein
VQKPALRPRVLHPSDERKPTILAYVLRRLAILILSLLIAAVVLFVLLRLLPGDPANALLSVGADQQQIEAAREQVGSNLPLWEQFLRFVGSLARFDLGTSFVSGKPVIEEIAARLTVTVPLALLGFGLAVMIAVPLGIVSAVKANRWYGAAISTVSQLGIAIPVFWVGILLVTVFAVNLRLFPSGGYPRRGWQNEGQVLYALALPRTSWVADRM